MMPIPPPATSHSCKHSLIGVCTFLLCFQCFRCMINQTFTVTLVSPDHRLLYCKFLLSQYQTPPKALQIVLLNSASLLHPLVSGILRYAHPAHFGRPFVLKPPSQRVERSLTVALHSLKMEHLPYLSELPEKKVDASSTPADLPSGCLAPQHVAARHSSMHLSTQDRERLMQAVLENHQRARSPSVAHTLDRADNYSAVGISHGL
jgi:hypothetical protein